MAAAVGSARVPGTLPWHGVTPFACAEQNPWQLLAGAVEQDRAVAVPSPPNG